MSVHLRYGDYKQSAFDCRFGLLSKELRPWFVDSNLNLDKLLDGLSHQVDAELVLVQIQTNR